MHVKLAKPRSFCAGVVRAIDIVERSLELYGPPVYVLHEIVHNHYVVDQLRQKGAVFVESLDDIPTGEKVVLAHTEWRKNEPKKHKNGAWRSWMPPVPW